MSSKTNVPFLTPFYQAASGTFQPFRHRPASRHQFASNAPSNAKPGIPHFTNFGSRTTLFFSSLLAQRIAFEAYKQKGAIWPFHSIQNLALGESPRTSLPALSGIWAEQAEKRRHKSNLRGLSPPLPLLLPYHLFLSFTVRTPFPVSCSRTGGCCPSRPHGR